MAFFESAIHLVPSAGGGVGALIALLAFGAAVLDACYYHRPQPKGMTRRLFQGIVYVREVWKRPRPMVIHAVVIDLDADGLHFLVTPPDRVGGRMLRSRTTSGFLEEFHLQVAINANYFRPFHTNSPWNYYPHVGDPVDVVGIAASRGDVYSAE